MQHPYPLHVQHNVQQREQVSRTSCLSLADVSTISAAVLIKLQATQNSAGWAPSCSNIQTANRFCLKAPALPYFQTADTALLLLLLLLCCNCLWRLLTAASCAIIPADTAGAGACCRRHCARCKLAPPLLGTARTCLSRVWRGWLLRLLLLYHLLLLLLLCCCRLLLQPHPPCLHPFRRWRQAQLLVDPLSLLPLPPLLLTVLHQLLSQELQLIQQLLPLQFQPHLQLLVASLKPLQLLLPQLQLVCHLLPLPT